MSFPSQLLGFALFAYALNWVGLLVTWRHLLGFTIGWWAMVLWNHKS